MATKKAPAKKPVKKAASPRKKTTKKAVSAEPSYLIKDSFRIAKDQRPFLSFKITIQTVYWTLLVAVIIFLQLWILQAQFRAAESTQAVSNSFETRY